MCCVQQQAPQGTTSTNGIIYQCSWYNYSHHGKLYSTDGMMPLNTKLRQSEPSAPKASVNWLSGTGDWFSFQPASYQKRWCYLTLKSHPKERSTNYLSSLSKYKWTTWVCIYNSVIKTVTKPQWRLSKGKLWSLI